MNTNTHHASAAELREAGKDSAALAAYDQAIAAYEQSQDWEGVARVWLERAIVYLHQFDDREELIILSQAFVALREADNCIQDYDLSLELQSLWALGTGNALMRRKEWRTAANHYCLALDFSNANPAVQANISAHEAYAMYLAGFENALERLDQAILILEKDSPEIPENTQRTWLSGALLKKAELLYESNPQEAQAALKTAEKIINQPPNLPIRQKQLKKLQQRMQG
jgi:tetratricopeptide (TPR) repeat protein